MGHEDWVSLDGYDWKQNDAARLVRPDPEVRQLPDEERDDE
jgi:hypothetical protein